MKDIAQHINATGIATTDVDASPYSSAYKKSVIDMTMDRLFSDLKSIYPAWKQAWPTADDIESAKAVWEKAFKESGITISTVKIGLVKARLDTKDFIPSVGKFISWCGVEAEDIGLPSELDAWYEAQYQSGMQTPSYSHAAIKMAVAATGKQFIISQSEKRSKPLFLKNYKDIVEKVKNGFDVNQKRIEVLELDPYVSILQDHLRKSVKSAKDYILEAKKQGVEIIVPGNFNSEFKFCEIKVIKKNSLGEGRTKAINDFLSDQDESYSDNAEFLEGLNILEDEMKVVFSDLEYDDLDKRVKSFHGHMINPAFDENARHQASRLMALAKEAQQALRKKMEFGHA